MHNVVHFAYTYRVLYSILFKYMLLYYSCVFGRARVCTYLYIYTYACRRITKTFCYLRSDVITSRNTYYRGRFISNTRARVKRRIKSCYIYTRRTGISKIHVVTASPTAHAREFTSGLKPGKVRLAITFRDFYYGTAHSIERFCSTHFRYTFFRRII